MASDHQIVKMKDAVHENPQQVGEVFDQVNLQIFSNLENNKEGTMVKQEQQSVNFKIFLLMK